MSSDSTPPDPVFFTDHNLGRYDVPDALRAAGAHVETHLAHFAPDLPDPPLLAEVGKRGWIFLSKDGNISRRPLEKQALMDAHLKAFVLSSGNLTGAEQAAAFVAALPAMLKLCARHKGPFVARVTRGGDVKIIVE